MTRPWRRFVSNHDFCWVSYDFFCYVSYFMKVAPSADRISNSYPGYITLSYIITFTMLFFVQKSGLWTGDGRVSSS